MAENDINVGWNNPLEDKDEVTLEEYLEVYKSRLTQDSERLFVTDFLYPTLGKENIKYCVPQYPFIDSEGRKRRIDFGLKKDQKKIALEVNGETYHAEGIIPNEAFDDNLNRQNEILNAGWYLLRYSYTQLLSGIWRKRVQEQLRKLLYKVIPEVLSKALIEPHYLQHEVLEALNFYREKGRKKGIVVLPTGTGKTFLSAFDTLNASGRILFIVHRLDILSQAREAFEKIYPEEKLGLLAGGINENVYDSKVLFASKDTLRNPRILSTFEVDEFDYMIVDEVHHGQAPSYTIILEYFKPNLFMLGLTATPDRMDRKDIFELFDYNKVFEYTLNDAIVNGFLVPYDYIGLKDNIDYSNIRHNGNKYNVQDLDRYLIIDKRNQKIFDEYVNRGKSNKAIGFCASIKHAKAMAKFFNEKGILSVAITSDSIDRAEATRKFTKNEVAIAFTVDFFNEGVDFPNVRVLMFLRPTESKTVFLQQLGRGLRLNSGKEKVIVLDFISNYKKANNIRKFLSKGKKSQVNPKTGRVEKIEYEYAPRCNVEFDAEVTEILDRQDTTERTITKADLIDAYYTLTENLGKKPTQSDLNEKGEFRVSKYLQLFESWVKFLREIGELTEASYHFPQGTHLGHIFYIIKTIQSQNLKNTHLDDRYVKLRGGLSKDKRLSGFQRQTKYKLQAAMEIGLIVDDRTLGNDEAFSLELTPKGKVFYQTLSPVINQINLTFKDKGGNVPSWEMVNSVQNFNLAIAEYIRKNTQSQKAISSIFLEMPAVNLMLNYLYRVERKVTTTKANIYSDFFRSPFVKQYCEQLGIETASAEGAKRRCPFLLNMLESIDVISINSSNITIKSFIISDKIISLDSKTNDKDIKEKRDAIISFSSNKEYKLSDAQTTSLRESFGKDFLTKNYHLKNYTIIYSMAILQNI